jgi:gas vesicle protein
MYKNKIMNSGKVLLGIIAGLTAGALLGVLFAPGKNTVARKKKIKKSNDSIDELKEKFNELLDDIADKYERAIINSKE